MGEARTRFIINHEGKPNLNGSTGVMRAMRDAKIKELKNEETYRNVPLPKSPSVMRPGYVGKQVWR